MEQLCPSSLPSFFAICRGVRLLFFCQKYLHVCILNSKITLALKVYAQKKQMNSLYVITLLGLKPSKADGTK